MTKKSDTSITVIYHPMSLTVLYIWIVNEDDNGATYVTVTMTVISNKMKKHYHTVRTAPKFN